MNRRLVATTWTIVGSLAVALGALAQPAQPLCTEGRVSTPQTQGRCCWPNQKWSTEYGRCDGPPNCPDNWTSHGDDCVHTVPSGHANGAVGDTCSDDNECGSNLVCGSSSKCVRPGVKAACSWIGNFNSDAILGPGDGSVNNILKSIGQASHISNLPQAMSGNVPNAMAAIYGRTRVIVYSPSFLQQLTQAAGGSSWAVKFVLAHELGHHVEGHTVAGDGSNWQAEYQADAWGAHALKNMGATLDQVLTAMNAYPMPSSATHPGTEQRKANIRRAYSDNDGPTPGEDGMPGPGGNGPTPTGGVPGGGMPFPQTPPVPAGVAAGTPIEPCGCRWAPMTQGPAPICASGMGLAVACPGRFCSPFAPATAVICR